MTLVSAARSQLAATGTGKVAGNPESYIEELISTPDFGTVYIADGAGDGSVLNNKPAVAIKRIINLQREAIPLLIAHLDDTRLTSAKYKGGHHWADPVRVPVGYVCLDILSQIVSDRQSLFVQGRRDCDFDGMGSCIRSKYYFSPEDCLPTGSLLAPSNRMLTTKRNWQNAYKAGLLQFRLPPWLERFRAAYSVNQ